MKYAIMQLVTVLLICVPLSLVTQRVPGQGSVAVDKRGQAKLAMTELKRVVHEIGYLASPPAIKVNDFAVLYDLGSIAGDDSDLWFLPLQDMYRVEMVRRFIKDGAGKEPWTENRWGPVLGKIEAMLEKQVALIYAGRAMPSASYICKTDTLDALNDGLVPRSSKDHLIPRFTWWDKRGTKEHVQYDFASPRRVSWTSIYWFDDTGIGLCRVPLAWKLLYKHGDSWKQVKVVPSVLTDTTDFGIEKDQFNHVSFTPIETDAMRVVVELRDMYSGGILEWRINGKSREEALVTAYAEAVRRQWLAPIDRIAASHGLVAMEDPPERQEPKVKVGPNPGRITIQPVPPAGATVEYMDWWSYRTKALGAKKQWRLLPSKGGVFEDSLQPGLYQFRAVWTQQGLQSKHREIRIESESDKSYKLEPVVESPE